MVISAIRKAEDHLKEFIKLLYIFPAYKKLLKEYKKCAQRKIVLVGSPAHGNLGDQAIAISELQFIQDYKKEETVFEIPTPLYKTHRSYLKKHINADDLVIVSGGGWMGNLWIHNEIMIRNIIADYPSNKIIIFPQTLYYAKDAEGKRVADETKVYFQNHDNIYLSVRDAPSYHRAQELLGIDEKSRLLFCPDMVLYGALARENTSERNKRVALICLRQDIEKAANLAGLESVVESAGYIPQETTTVYRHLIKIRERKKVVTELVFQYSKAGFMITDRLHAMIFSLLAGIPCYVFNNGTGKVFGVASYLQNANMPVKMLRDIGEISPETFDLSGKPYELSDGLREYFRQLGCLLNI